MLHKTKSTIAYNLICTYNLTQMHVTFVYRKYTLCFLKKSNMPVLSNKGPTLRQMYFRHQAFQEKEAQLTS